MRTDDVGLHFVAGLDNDELRSDCEKSKRILQGVGDSAAQEGNRIDDAFKKAGAVIAGVFTVQKLSQFVSGIVKVRSEIESLEISFETLLGNKDKAAALFGEIRQFAVQTPMMLNDLAKGAQMLLSFNVAADQVMPTLRAIGDISMGDAQNFQSLTLAFSQMSSTGKLMGQDFLQMINAGFNPLAIISEKTGKSISALKDEMSKGQISAQMVADAFRDATSEGGMFYKMLEKQSEGLNGMRSNLQGAVDDMMNSLGETMQKPITNTLELVTDLVKNYKEVGRVIAELIAIYGVYKAAVIAVTVAQNAAKQAALGYTVAQQLQYKWMLMQEAAQKLLNKTMLANPYVAAAAAIAVLTVGIIRLVTHQNDAEKAQKRLDDAFKESEKNIQAEQVQVDLLFGRLKAAKEGSEEYKKAKQMIINQYGDYLRGLNSEIQSLQDVEGAYRAITDAITEAARARAMEKFTKDEADDYAEKMGDIRETVREKMLEKFGSEKGYEYYWKIVPVLEGKEELTDELQDVVGQFDESNYVFTGPGMPGYVSHFNAIEAAINRAHNAKKVFDDAMSAAEARFGDVKIKKDGEGGEGGEAPAPQNKAYYDELVKTLTAQYEAMTLAERDSEKGKALARQIAENQEIIDGWSVKSGTKAVGQQANYDREAATRIREIGKYTESVKLAEEQASLDIRQAKLDLEDDSYKKQLSQNKLNYDLLIFENKKRIAEYLESYRDMKEKEWENNNPTAKQEGRVFDRASVTVDEWRKAQPALAAQVEEFDSIAFSSFERANRESLESMLEEFADYEQRRLKIQQEYATKRNALYTDDGSELREGVSQGNVEELDRAEQQALTALDELFAARSNEYEAWCNKIAAFTLEELETVLKQAEEALAEAEQNSSMTPQQLAEARAKVSKAQEAVSKKKASADTGVDRRSLKEWEDLYKTLGQCGSELDNIGDSIGGVAGEFISTAGQVMTSTVSMVSGITQLVQMSSQGMSATATTAATAMSIVEKASVILTVISAALQIATAIANMFNDDEAKQDEIDSLQRRIDQLQWELDNPDILRLQQAQGKAIDIVNNALRESAALLNEEYKSAINLGQVFDYISVKAEKNARVMEEAVARIADAYAAVSYTADKAMGEERYADSRQQLENIAQQQLLIQQQIDAERDKKDSDENQIDEWERKIEELGAEAVQIINDMVEDIMGGSAAEIAEQLSDAFFEAFANGEDAAEAWGKKVDDIVSDILKRLLVQKFLEEPLGEIFNRYKEKWFPGGNFVGIEELIDSIPDLQTDLNGVYEGWEAFFSALPQDLLDMIGGDGGGRTGEEKGIAQASQDSVDELNGRATAIQGHTFSIAENTQLLLATANAILASVLNIEDSTDGLTGKVDSLNNQMKAMRDDINYIVTNGIKIR